MGATSTKKEQQKLFQGKDTPIKRSTFNLGYKNKLTAPFNKLVPTCSKHIMPGDSVHAKTSFFTRWLGLQAPVFSDYQIKFGSWFCKYSQLWAGWDQFFGEGDSQSADYLIDGSRAGKYGSRVPYFTSRDISKLAWGRIFPSICPPQTLTNLEKYPLFTKERWRKYFRMVLVPVCAFRTTHSGHEYNYFYPSAPSDWLQGYYQGNDVNEDYKNEVILTPMLWRNDTFTKQCIDNALIFDLDSIPDQQTKYDLSDWVTLWSGTNLLSTTQTRVPNWAFTYVGTNLPIFRDHEGEEMDFAVYEMSHDCLPLDIECFGAKGTSAILPSGTDLADELVTAWNNVFPGDPETAPISQYFGLCANYHFKRMSAEEQRETGFVYGWYQHCSAAGPVPYQIYGYMRSLSPTELYNYTTGTNLYCTWQQLWERTFGQMAVRALLGTGTLADYLGYNYEEQLLRQPFNLASAIQVSRTYNGESIAHNPYKYKKTELGGYKAGPTYQNERWTEALSLASSNQFGNYNQASASIGVGVVNDVPISCFKFLAYHKCFSDTLRDQRYQLRWVYADPYTSPFLIPQGDGTFISGEVLATEHDTDTNKFKPGRSPWYEEDNRNYINTGNWFTEQSLFEFLTLRDRRITQDYNTLIVPTQQYGDVATADIEIESNGLAPQFVKASGAPPATKAALYLHTDGTMGISSASGYKFDEETGLKGSVDVNSLRYLGRLQKYLERSLIAGSSYVKQVLARFGVTPSQSVTQRLETRYLGGDRYYPTISPVEMLGANDTESGQQTGSQTGSLSCSGTTGEVSFKSNDAGIFIQLMTIQNEFLTTGNETEMIEKFDFPMPEFADLQPQAVPLSEIVMTDGTDNTGYGSADPNLCFGYVPRYAPHKCSKDQIHGQFKTDLSYWVTPRRFNPNLSFGSFGLGDKNNIPELGENFLYEDPNYNAFTDTSEENHKCILDLQHFIKVSRELPMLPTPTLH